MRRKISGVIGLALAAGVIALMAFALGTRNADVLTVGEKIAPEVASHVESDPPDAVLTSVVEPEVVSHEAGQTGGPQEGVKVHGRWTIEVTEPDGRLVSRNEFDNALVTQFGIGGRSSLVKILGHEKSVGYWRVELVGPSGAEPCILTGPSGNSVECVLTELPPTHSFVTTLNNYFSGLTVEVGDSLGPNADELVLSGSVTVQNSADITGVHTRVQLCPTDASPDDALSCSGPSNRFTEKTLNSAVPVVENQVVNVTVVFSFS